MTTNSNSIQTYDEVPYPSGPLPLSHPCHLAMIGKLFDWPTADVENCRVLELGCASGGNLIPMAQDFPNCEFLGIDLSVRQIDDGQATLDELQLANIKLRQMDLTDAGADLGSFDYIICHGVYSWVPPAVQDRILQIGRDHLAQRGVLYVSYNTYPGWHLRGIARDMMVYHAAAFSSPEEKLAQSRELLNYLARSASGGETYRQILRDEAEHLQSRSDQYIYHEHLEENNRPVYFHQFMDKASEAGLRYLGDSEFHRMMLSQFDEATAAILADAPLLRQEQYIDFLTARTFRYSLLCHEAGAIDRSVTPARLSGLSLSLAESMELTQSAGGESTYAGPTRSVTTGREILCLAVDELNQIGPAWITTEELLQRVRSQLSETPADVESRILGEFLLLISRGIIQAAVSPPAITTQPGPTPQTTPWARLQARRGLPRITNRRHMYVAADELTRFVISRLDGQHDRQRLVAELQSALSSGALTATREGNPVTRVNTTELQELLDRVVIDLARSALLIP